MTAAYNASPNAPIFLLAFTFHCMSLPSAISQAVYPFISQPHIPPFSSASVVGCAPLPFMACNPRLLNKVTMPLRVENEP